MKIFETNSIDDPRLIEKIEQRSKIPSKKIHFKVTCTNSIETLLYGLVLNGCTGEGPVQDFELELDDKFFNTKKLPKSADIIGTQFPRLDIGNNDKVCEVTGIKGVSIEEDNRGVVMIWLDLLLETK